MIYEFINPQDIPEDLPQGKYTTRVIETGFKNDDFWVKLEYLGKPYSKDNLCLFPLEKNETISVDSRGAETQCSGCGRALSLCFCSIDISDDKTWREYTEILTGIE